MLPNVIEFKILPDYEIEVLLSSGKRGIFDVKPYLDKGIFTDLRDVTYFKNAKIEYGTITWKNGQDLSPNTIDARMKSI